MKRSKMSKKSSNKMFKRTIQHRHKKNNSTYYPNKRGGGRL